MQGLKAELLRGFWYMALPGAKLKTGKLAHLMMLGEPIVVGRGRDGKVFARCATSARIAVSRSITAVSMAKRSSAPTMPGASTAAGPASTCRQ